MEQRPALVNNIGMATRICNYYQPSDPDSPHEKVPQPEVLVIASLLLLCVWSRCSLSQAGESLAICYMEPFCIPATPQFSCCKVVMLLLVLF